MPNQIYQKEVQTGIDNSFYFVVSSDLDESLSDFLPIVMDIRDYRFTTSKFRVQINGELITDGEDQLLLFRLNKEDSDKLPVGKRYGDFFIGQDVYLVEFDVKGRSTKPEIINS